MGAQVDSFGDIIAFYCGSTIQICTNLGEKKQTLVLQESCEGSNGKSLTDSNTNVSCIRFSPDGSLLGIATDSKLLYIWDTKTWQLLGTKKLLKRPMALSFDPKLSELLLADKTGDVYSFPLVNGAFKEDGGNSTTENRNGNNVEEEIEKEKVPILGHLSMLLDMIITNDGQYIVTCDRDEKIRVSKFPNSYNIQTFCLGHTEFVTKILELPTDKLKILSCSGDGSLKLWNPENGSCEASFDTSEAITPELMNYFKQATSKLQEMQKEEENKKQPEVTNVRAIPNVPAIKLMAVHAEGCTTLIALTLDRIPGIFLYKIEGCNISFIASKEVTDSILDMTWMDSGELVTVNTSVENPVSVMMLKGTEIVVMKDHALVKFGKNSIDLFKGYLNELSLDSYYKQRVDNITAYLRKKEERIAGSKRSNEDETPNSKMSRIVINEEL